MNNITYKSDLGKAKGLGGSKSGISHWIWQRISAASLVPLFIWFIYMIVSFLVDPEYALNKLLYAPFELLFFVILINLSIYHGVLGFKVICEDYIHNEFAKIITIVSCYFISFITMCTVTFVLMMNFIINI